MRLVITGGGTGGHTYPLIAVTKAVTALSASYGQEPPDVYYVGPDGFAGPVIEKEGIDTHYIASGKIRRYFSLWNFLDPFKIIVGFFQSLWWLWYIMPDAIFSKGGFGAVPVIVAAWIYRIPVIIHESDSIPGIANKFSAHFARSIGVSFSTALKYFPAQKTALVGNPIDTDLLHGEDRKASGGNLGIYSNKPIVGFLGGSQGATQINEVVLDILPRLVSAYEIVHITGKNNFTYIQKESEGELKEQERYFYHPFSYLDNFQMKDFYNACDLVVARAGSGTIFELAAFGKPSILIPLENSASDHQRENASLYGHAGACIVLETANLTPNLLLENIRSLFADQQVMAQMSANAAAFAKTNAAELIAQQLLRIAKVIQ